MRPFWVAPDRGAVGDVLRLSKALSERERRFVEAYMGKAAGNATKAAELAGYSVKSARRIGTRLSTKDYIQAAIESRQSNAPDVADRAERQAFWTTTMRTGERMTDRLKASELLGRSGADFIERHEHTHRVSLVDLLAGDASDG